MSRYVGTWIDTKSFGRYLIVNSIPAIKGIQPQKLRVRFEDTGYEVDAHASNASRGLVKDVLHRSLFDVGYLGEGKYAIRLGGKPTPEGTAWTGMLRRCYDKEHQATYSTYIGCSVCPTWHNFQTFASWFTKRYKGGYHLDKDILTKGNKVYSPTTCVVVPRAINLAVHSRVKGDTDLPLGVSSRTTGRYVSSITKYGKSGIYLGLFHSVAEASSVYVREKESYVKELALQYYKAGGICEWTYRALLRWGVY